MMALVKHFSFPSQPISLISQDNLNSGPDDHVSFLRILKISVAYYSYYTCILLKIPRSFAESSFRAHSIPLISHFTFSVLFLLLLFGGMINCHKVNIHAGFKHSLLNQRRSTINDTF